MSLRLSVIVPVLNEAANIEAVLHALSAMRAEGAEVIVVDGGSADRTTDLAAPWCDRVIEADRGRASQMNAGAKVASGDIFLFLHADTFLPPHAPELIRDAIDTRKHAWGRFDVEIEGKATTLRLVACLMNLRSRLTGIATGDQALFVRREAFFAIGGFPQQALMEDIEISRQLRRHGAPACLSARVCTSGRRWEQRGIWRTVFLMWRLRLLYWLGVAPEKLARAYR